MNEPWWPEPKFFLRSDSVTRVDEYLKKLYSQDDVLVRGEKTVSYMEHPDVAGRIKLCFADALILFMIRDPINRAISNYWYSRNNGLEDETIDEVLSNESLQDRPYDKSRITGCPPYHYLMRGKYVDYIERFLEHFDRGQIKVLVNENVVGNRAAVRDLFEFLGVEPAFVSPSIDEKVNGEVPADSGHIRPETEAFLREYYRKANQELENRFQLDLSRWRSQITSKITA